MRLCPDRPLLPQQHVQHLQQQMAHSAPQQMQRAMHTTMDMTMSDPTMIATMTGHLSCMSIRRDTRVANH
jgi:hypothetical protein